MDKSVHYDLSTEHTRIKQSKATCWGQIKYVVASANHSSSSFSFSSALILLFLIIHQNYFQCTT